MRKSLGVAAVAAAIIFGLGYLVGGLRGVTPGSAASPADHSWNMKFHDDVVTGPRAMGTVTAINGNSITIKPVAGALDAAGVTKSTSTVTTVVVSSSTKYLTRPGTTASQSAIKVGSFIVAAGTLSSDGTTLTASKVVILPKTPTMGAFGHRGPGATGQITAVNGNTVTIKPLANRDGKGSAVTTIVLTGSTQYEAKGTASADKSEVKAGLYIRAQGTLSADGKTLTAARVEVSSSLTAIDVPHRGIFGQVTAISGNTVSIKPGMNWKGAGSVSSIVLTSTTTYSTAPDTSATKDAVKVGSYIVARGKISTDGKTLTATSVMILPAAPSFNGHGFFHPFGRFHWESSSNAMSGPSV